MYSCYRVLGSLLVAIFSLIPLLSAQTEEPQYQFVGRHFVAQYYNCDTTALNNIQGLSNAMKQATAASGAHLLKTIDYAFEPCGFTMVLLLSESHASIHTYPEHKACFVDFFTCGTRCSAENFDAYLRRYLHPMSVVSDVKERR